MSDPTARLDAALHDRYTIEREVGAGGMATVYLAHDVRHDRKVALKVLRPELAAIVGAERFLAEIKTTANLQHPHILSLFDSGEAGGVVYYVMPFVEGENLRDRLKREHQLPVGDALRIAGEVLDALEYAHQHRVIHRDIKPENILLHGGHALVADFGIALAVSRSDGGTRMTETGMSLGTPHYMAPEQAMGEKEITPKADVYAMGCVLYEMLTGEPPFTGATAQAIIARVMTEEPRSITMQRRTVLPHVDAAVEKALSKVPADRFSSAAQFAEALAHPESMPVAPTGARVRGRPSPVSSRTRMMQAGALTLAVVAGAAAWAALAPGPKPRAPNIVRFGIELPRDAQPVGATGSTIAFSPDGSRIVYVGRAPVGQRLYSRGLDQLDPVPIPGTDGAILPFFSEGGAWLGFKQGNRLARIAFAGGPVTPICDTQGETYGATWTTGDTVIFASDSGLFEVPAAGGVPHLVAKPDSGELFRWPSILPGDRGLLFTVFSRGTARLAAFTRHTRKVKRLQQSGGYPQYVASGYVVLSDPSGILSAVPFDAGRLEVTGAAFPFTEKLQTSVDGDRNLGVSATGDLAFQSATTGGRRLLLVDRNGAVREVQTDTGLYFAPRLSPDGRRVALGRWTDINFSSRDVWVIDLAQRTRTRLTFDTTAGWPVWAPDGRRIAYQRGQSIYWVPADGSGAPEPLLTGPGNWFPALFEPRGRGLIYHGVASGQPKAEIGRVGIVPRDSGRQVLRTSFHNYDPSLSPDGRWMAYISDESGRFEVYVRPYPGPGGRWQVSLDGGTEPVWSPTGREIFYRNGDQMMAATVTTTGAFEVGARTQLFEGSYHVTNQQITGYDVSRDGRTFVMLQTVQGTSQTVFVTLNWFDQLRRNHQ